MTLALLLTAATGAWAQKLYLDVDGTSATLKWGTPSNGSIKYDQMSGYSDESSQELTVIQTLTIDASCKDHTLIFLYRLFADFNSLKTINNIENLKTEGVTNMSYMFYQCSSLQSLDLSSFKTASVTNMTAMFGGCSSLQSLDLSSFNTASVTLMSFMFYKCSSLQSLDLSSFNTASVDDMGNMFDNCSNLENIYVGDGWSTQAVTNGDYMFYNCPKLPGYDESKTSFTMAKLTTDGGYLKVKPAVTPVEMTWNESEGVWEFDMPEGNVELEMLYYSLTGVTLADGSSAGGTATLLKEDYSPLTADDKVKEGERFVLLVDKTEGYDFGVTLSTGEKAAMTEFTAGEYNDYIDYAKEQGIAVSPNTVMKWVTMPHVDTDVLTMTMDMQKQKTFTMLYQPTDAATDVWVRFGVTKDGEESFTYSRMSKNSQMGDKDVWSMKMLSSFAPTKVAFFTTEEAAANDAATMSSAVVSTTANWNDITGGQYLLVGGNATTKVAAFVTDAKSAPLYSGETVNIDYNRENPGVTYQIAVCQTDENGNVTSPGAITLLAAPTAPEGKVFTAWRTLEGNAPDKNEQLYTPGRQYSIYENMTFTAVWQPIQVKTTFALNGGTGFDAQAQTTYGQTLALSGEPTRKGFVFDKWTVAKAVSESGVLFGRGSEFDMNTKLTADIDLVAQWKHVHEYTCYPISRFPSLQSYMKYNGVLHIAVCGCDDIEIVEHEFNPAGKCVCGYEKPGATKLQLDIAYGKLEGTSFTTFANGFPEFPTKGQEVTVEAFHNWGDLEFQKWQYSTDGGTTWYDLAAFEIVGFLIPCSMQTRAIYVNPVQTPTIELATSQHDDYAQQGGQTYTMDNILYQMNYKLPDGYKLLDAGIRMGDNSGISYYEQKERTYSYDAEAKAIAIGMLTVVSILNGEPTTADMSATEKYWAERENSVLDEISSRTLAEHMMNSKPINVEKYDPIYWEATAQTKGLSGSMATMPPLRFAQKNNQNHYIYGVGYIRYKDNSGNVKTLYTDAVAATVNNPNQSTVNKELIAGARQVTRGFDENTAAARKAPKSQPTDEQLDLSTITAPQTQLVVYADGKYNAQLSDAYGYGETATVTAPDVQGKTFSYWTADGSVISTGKTLTFTMNANTTLRAIYDEATVPAFSPAGITSVTRSNDGEKINIQAVANGTFTEAGFVYSTTATGDNLTIGVEGVKTIVAVNYRSLGNEAPASVLDRNNCWSAQITPDAADAIYHVRAYTKNGSDYSYGDVKDVKFSSLKSGMKMTANIEAFEHEADPALSQLLTQLKNAGQLPAGYAIEVPAGEYATYFKDEALYVENENAQLYTISSVTESEAVLSDAITVAPANTPLLVYNKSQTETLTFLLRPTTDKTPDNVTAATQFVGTLEATTIPASATGADNYALNGYAFVWVKNAIEVGANKCWLHIASQPAAARAMTRSIVGGNGTTGIDAIENVTIDNEGWYDLQGRKLQAKPNRGGIYIHNGKKVVIR